jgi:hypothetical protein
MAKACPVKNSPEWIYLTKELGDMEAMKIFLANDEDLPDMATNMAIVAKYNDEVTAVGSVETSKLADLVKALTGKNDAILESIPENKLKDVLDDVRIFIKGKLDKLKESKIKNQAFKRERFERLQIALTTSEAAKGASQFISDVYENLQAETAKLKKNLSDIKAGKYGTQESLALVNAYNEYIHELDILDEFQKVIGVETFGAPKSMIGLSATEKLSEAIKIKDSMRNLITEEAIPLIAKDLSGYKSADTDKRIVKQVEPLIKRANDKIAMITNDLMKAKAAKNEKEVTKLSKQLAAQNEIIRKLEDIILQGDASEHNLTQTLKEASKEQGFFERWLSPIISSSDSALALFAVKVKDSLEDARIRLLDFVNGLTDEHEIFAKASGRNVNNPASFFKGFHETVTEYRYDEDTKTIVESKRYQAYVQKDDITAYTKAQAEMYKVVAGMRARAKTTKDEKAITKFIEQWYQDNTEPKSQTEIQEIIASKKQDVVKGYITKEEYKAWEAKTHKFNMHDPSQVDSYRRELARPKRAIYGNKNYQDMRADKAMSRYYDFLIKQHFYLQEEIPDANQLGFRLWGIPKNLTDKLLEGQGLEAVKEEAKRDLKHVEAHDTKYGDKQHKVIPIHFTPIVDPKEVSVDLYKASMIATRMVENYKELNKMRDSAELMKEIIKARKTKQTNSTGSQLLDKTAEKLGLSKMMNLDKEETNDYKQLEGYIDKIFYGETAFKLSVGSVAMDKVIDGFIRFTTLTTLGADPLKAVANWLQGNVQIHIESAAKENFSPASLAKGKAFYLKHMPKMLGDFATRGTNSMVGQLAEYFDAIQGEFSDSLGKRISGSVAKRLFSTDTAFYLMHAGEHEVQVSTLLAMLADNTVKTTDGKEISMLDAFEQKDGKLKVKDNIVWTDQDRKNIIRKLHPLNERLHGIYNNHSRAEIEKHAVGRLAMVFRRFVVPGYKRRFKNMGVDHQAGLITEGYYKTFLRTVVQDLREKKWESIYNWSEYTDQEKANLKRTYAELSAIISLSVIAAVIGAAGDDDDDLKDSWAYNFALYEAMRLRSETMFFVNPADTIRILYTPSSTTFMAQRILKFMNSVLPWNIDEEYQRDAGKFKKGDNKAWANFQKLMGLSGNNLHPDQAVKILKMFD